MVEAGAIRAARADLLQAIESHGEPAVIEALKRVLNEMKRARPKRTEDRAQVVAIAAKVRGRQQSLAHAGAASADAAEAEAMDAAAWDDDAVPW
jgi:hypothetical protein